jgi:hypothetical protein
MVPATVFQWYITADQVDDVDGIANPFLDVLGRPHCRLLSSKVRIMHLPVAVSRSREWSRG